MYSSSKDKVRPVFLVGVSLVLMVAGCEKVPTFQELTGQQPAGQQAPATAAPVTSQETKQSSGTAAISAVVAKPVDPAEVIAEFQQKRRDGVTDQDILKLTQLSAGLEQIQTIDLSHSAVSDEGLKLIGPLSELSDLNLTSLKVTGSGLAGLQGNQKLRLLTLNSIQTMTPEGWDTLARLEQLEKLSLNGSPITDREFAKLTRLQNLKELDLSQTAITDASFEKIAQLPNLEVLRMEMNSHVTGSGLQAIAKAKSSSLREIHAMRTKLAIAGLKHIKAIPRLELLDISDSLLTDQQFLDLRGVNHLTTLHVGYNRLTAASMPIITGISKLKILRLDHQLSIDDSSLAVLNRMRGLDVLDIRSTNCSSTGVAAFRKTHKNCEVLIE